MLLLVSGYVTSILNKYGVVKDDHFFIVSEVIRTLLFGVITITAYMTMGFLIGYPVKVFEAMLVYNIILNLLNKGSQEDEYKGFHCCNALSCGIFSGISIFTVFTLSMFISNLIGVEKLYIIWVVITATTVVMATLSEKGKSYIRHIESIFVK